MVDYMGQHYRLVRLLGQGGLAEVYRGEPLHLETQEAITMLSTPLAPQDVEQFHHQAHLIARLLHLHHWTRLRV